MKNYLCRQCDTCKFLTEHNCWKTFDCRDCENYKYDSEMGGICGCLQENIDGKCPYYQKEKDIK